MAIRRSWLAAPTLGVVAALIALPGPARAGSSTFDDAAGDQRDEDGQVGRSAAADILSVQVVYGSSELTLGVELAGEPETEYRTDFTLNVDWLLEFDDSHPGHDAVVGISTLGSSVLEDAYRIVGSERIPCEVTGQLEGRRVTAARIPVGCAGSGDALRVTAAVDYDDPDDGDPLSERDAAPDHADGGISYFEPVARTERAGPRPTRRLAGQDRFATAVAVSRARTPDVDPQFGEYRVFLARADEAADALAAGNTGETVLLVPSCGPIPGVVADELARLRPQFVIALGGEFAVCGQVLADAAAAAGEAEADRLAGPSRYETAIAIGDATAPDICDDADCPPIGDLYLARGDDFADALAAASLDAGPLLLVPSCGTVPDAVLAAAGSSRFLVREVVAVGGRAAVCDAVLDQVADAADAGSDRMVTRRRLAGANRVLTSVEISRARYPSGALEVALATAADFPDALTGGSLPDGPVLLVPTGCVLPADVEGEIARLNPSSITVLGGEQAVCQDVVDLAAR